MTHANHQGEPGDTGTGAERKPHPFWYPLSKLEIAARGNRGAALTRDDVEALKASLIGPLMAAAHAYGTSGSSDTSAVDPVILPGATVVASAPTPPDRVGEEVGRALAAFVAAEAERVRTIEAYNADLKQQRERGIFPVKVQAEYEAMERAQRAFWTAQHDLLSVASAPPPEAGAGGDLGELERHDIGYALELAERAFHCEQSGRRAFRVPDDGSTGPEVLARVQALLLRSGKLVASTGSEEETKGAAPYLTETTEALIARLEAELGVKGINSVFRRALAIAKEASADAKLPKGLVGVVSGDLIREIDEAPSDAPSTTEADQ